MNLQSTISAVENRDDAMLNQIELAVLAEDDADTEARNDTTRAEVLERLTEIATDRRDKAFMRALRQGDKQSIVLMITQIYDAFEEVVREKRNVILAKKND